MRYKLETYQKNYLNFIYDSPISTQVSSQDEEIETGPSGTIHEEEVQIEEPQDLKSGATKEEEVQTKKPQDLRGGGQEEKEPQKNQEQQQVETIPTIEEKVSKI